MHTINASVGSVQSINRKNVNGWISIELLGNMIIKKSTMWTEWHNRNWSQLIGTKTTRIYHLRNMLFWPEALLLVYHGGDFFLDERFYTSLHLLLNDLWYFEFSFVPMFSRKHRLQHNCTIRRWKHLCTHMEKCTNSDRINMKILWQKTKF